MKKLLISILLPLAYLVFFGALMGKQHAPEIFGTPMIQYGSAVFTAIACPVCILISLSLAFGSLRLMGPLLVAFSALPVVFALSMDCIIPSLLGMTSHTLMQPQFSDIDVIASWTLSARNPDADFTERSKSASALYRFFGVTPVILDSARVLRAYEPTSDDEKGRNSNRELRKQMEAVRSQSDQTFKEVPWLFAIDLVSCVLILGGGLVFSAMRGTRLERSSTPTAP